MKNFAGMNKLVENYLSCFPMYKNVSKSNRPDFSSIALKVLILNVIYYLSLIKSKLFWEYLIINVSLHDYEKKLYGNSLIYPEKCKKYD